MKKEEKKSKLKIETVEEYIARGGRIAAVDFTNAHGLYKNYGRDMKVYTKNYVKNKPLIN